MESELDQQKISRIFGSTTEKTTRKPFGKSKGVPMESDDVKFAKLWAGMQEPPVEVRHITDYPNRWQVYGLPEWIEIWTFTDGWFDNENEAWGELADELAKYRRSLEPAIRQRLEAEIRKEINEENDRGLM